MFQLSDLYSQLFFLGARLLLRCPLTAAIFQACFSKFTELLDPCVYLLIADSVLQSCFAIVIAVGDTILCDFDSFLLCCLSGFLHAAASTHFMFVEVLTAIIHLYPSFELCF